MFVACLALGWDHRGAGQAPGPAAVGTATVVEQEIQEGQTFVASVLPLRIARVGSPVDQRVAEFLINDGDRVTKGQPLARLRTTSLEIDIAAARAELELHKYELAELENGSRQEEKDQAQAKIRSAEAMLRFAEAKFKRTRHLAENGNVASQQELEEALSAAELGRANVAEATAAAALVAQGPRKERILQARAKVQAQQELINRMLDELERHTIRSPFDGYVVAEHTEVGEWLAKNALVAEIAELHDVEVEVQVLEDHIQHVRVGDEARVEIGALPSRVFVGPIVSVRAQANLRSRTFPVKVRLHNEVEAGSVIIKAGMFARVTMPVGSKQRALLVPKDAIVLGGPTPVVYAIDRNTEDPQRGSVRQVPVTLGVAAGERIQVKGALKPTELVVVRGNERLRPGQEVVMAAAK